jgi:streptogramin lyase
MFKHLFFGMFISAAVIAMSACGDDSSSNSTTTESSATTLESSAAIPESSAAAPESSAATSPESSATAPASSAAPAKDTVWNKAHLTWYTSWPEPGSEECEDYNGCTWAGWFAGLDEQQTEEWVSQHNIIAVHEKDWKTYKLKTFRLKQNGRTIDAVVYDMCSDSDCDGCCTENAGELGFLIDIESYSCKRFTDDGDCDGVVEWTCLDCE